MNSKYISNHNITIAEALKKISHGGQKSIIIVDKNKNFKGILSDGDIRRALLKGKNLKSGIEKIYNQKSYFQKYDKLSLSKINENFKKKKYDLIPILKKNKVIKIFFRSSFSIKTVNTKNKKFSLKKNNYKVVIMAGGKGSRLAPLTHVLPKPLLPVNGRPILSTIIKNFKKNGINKFIISINKNSQIIKEYIKSNETKSKINFDFIEEQKPLGTIGSLGLTKKLKAPFFVTNCDVLFNFDLNTLVSKFNKDNLDLLIVTVRIKNNLSYGICEFKKNGELLKIKEKPNFYYDIIGGLYMMSPKVLKYIPRNKSLDITNLINKIKKNKGKISTFRINEQQWNDIGEFTSYKETLKKLNV